MKEQEIHNSLKLLNTKRKKILELKERIAEAAIYISGSSWSSPKVTGGTYITPQEKYLERTERLKNQFAKALDEYGDLECKMFSLMDALSPCGWQVILNRFFLGMSVKKAANVMGYSVYYIAECQADAIKVMSKYSDKPHPD